MNKINERLKKTVILNIWIQQKFITSENELKLISDLKCLKVGVVIKIMVNISRRKSNETVSKI